MSRITPKQVVAAVEATFPWTLENSHHALSSLSSANLGMLLDLVDAVPSELLPTAPDDVVALFAARSAVRNSLAQWAGIDYNRPGTPLTPLPAFGGRSPVEVFRDVMLKGIEQAPKEGTTDLAFVMNDELRDSLRLDLSSSRSNFDRGEYKAATVLAGSVAEALLLDALERVDDATLTAAFREWRQRSKRPGETMPGSNLPPDKSRWSLHQLVWMARCADVISEETAAFADVSRDYRNLIHAGVSRVTMRADEGTAMAALGAALRIAAELERRAESKE